MTALTSYWKKVDKRLIIKKHIIPALSSVCVIKWKVITRDRPINRTYRLIAHSTSDFDDRLQFYKIDYFESFLKK